MAPDIAREVVSNLRVGQRLIDPMCGSGTVLREGVEAGLECVGYDIDPLAVLMASGWTRPVQEYKLLHDSHALIDRAKDLRPEDVELPWTDEATDAFARYWFAEPQFDALARLSVALRQTRLQSRDLLKLCMSRVVVTKDRGASLARDVSHSRPHKVMDRNDFDVYEGFLRASRQVARNLEPDLIKGSARVAVGDAKGLSERAGSFDAAVTSPPYLNAIDYVRGHRLSLIWLGYDVASLSTARSSQVGSERSLATTPFDISAFVRLDRGRTIGDRYVGWLRRYTTDMLQVMRTLQHLVRPGGQVVIVVGNSTIRGASFDNAGIIEECAKTTGLSLTRRRERAIPAQRRYLPPPEGGAGLGQRMRAESVFSFARDA